MESSELYASIEAAKAGSAQGYEAILAEYNPRLYGYFYRMTSNRHDAEDLLGELVLRLVRVLPKYDERGRFEPWLFRIAANLVRDRFRRRKVAPAIVSFTRDDDEPDPINSVPGPAKAVDAALLHQEACEQLDDALGTLDDSTREMIVLRHFSHMSYAEIAETMGCPILSSMETVELTPSSPRNKKPVTPRLYFIWPNGSSTFCLRSV